jgi:hypothetical protein
VERGAGVYTNLMNTYPPVMLAAWNRHAEVVCQEFKGCSGGTELRN